MNSFLHALATLTKRLRWELAALALLVPANAFATIFSPGSSLGLSSLVIIVFWWLTFRVVLSETSYSTNGGWKARPFSPNAILLARITVLFAVAVAAAAVRALTLWHLFHPTAAQWMDHLGFVDISVFLPWLVFTASVGLIALFWRAPLPSRARKAGAALLVIVAVGVVAWTLRTSLDDNHYRTGPGLRYFDTAIQRALPQAKRFIGPWNMNGSPAAPALFVVPGSNQVFPAGQMSPPEMVAIPILRIPFGNRAKNPAPGLHLLDLSHSATGGTVRVTLNMVAMNAEIVRLLPPRCRCWALPMAAMVRWYHSKTKEDFRFAPRDRTCRGWITESPLARRFPCQRTATRIWRRFHRRKSCSSRMSWTLATSAIPPLLREDPPRIQRIRPSPRPLPFRRRETRRSFKEP
jgi:hypothetical protein